MFTTDSRTENFLARLGVKFAYKSGIPFPSSLMPGWDKENIGRPVAVREDAVIGYANRMAQGSSAPAPILYMTPDGYQVCDGTQRLSAETLMQTTVINAYIVDTDSEITLLTIRVMANHLMQGIAEPPEWNRRRAIEVLIIDQCMSVHEVAKLGGWKVQDLNKIAEAIRLQTRITSVGGPDLPDSMLAELKPYFEEASFKFEQVSAPVVGFLNLLRQAKLSVVDSKPFLATFFAPTPKRATDLHKVYLNRLENLNEDPEIQVLKTGRQSVELSKDRVLLRALKSVETTLDHIMTHGEPLTTGVACVQILNRITGKLGQVTGRKKKK